MHSYKHGSKYILEWRNLVCRNFSCSRLKRYSWEVERERERERWRQNYVKEEFWSRRSKCHAADHFCDWTKTEIAFEIVLVLSFLYWDQTYCSRWNWSDCLVSCFCLFLILWNQAWHWFGIWHVFNCFCMAYDGYLTWNTGHFFNIH